MDKEMKSAPNILTTKDLDYLKDIFGWNHTAYKLIEDAINYATDKDICDCLNNASIMFYDNLKTVIKIVKDGSNEE